eukprot:TRINITY_DN9464_c0_g1_i1.p1 TRINITY_DN9464_c0_g1~~TRINITY_DN9464_c0_g1_i1.p1  ORF type:complete len:242 (+),score=34.00 TRINITY_DN9464_c0_g1_i1:182-907(+)
MLAIFQKSVAEGPSELLSPRTPPKASRSGRWDAGSIVRKFKQANLTAVLIHFDEQNALACTSMRQRNGQELQFCSMNDVFCCFMGSLDNLPRLRQLYGLHKLSNHAQFVIEAYKTLRDRAPFPPDQVVAEMSGSFAFVIFDHSSNNIFVAGDCEGRIPLYWGKTVDDEVLAFSNDASILKAGCGTSFAPFPKGCYYSSKDGLHSYQHPTKLLKPLPHVDSQGQLCGATFRVDSQPDLAKLV